MQNAAFYHADRQPFTTQKAAYRIITVKPHNRKPPHYARVMVSTSATGSCMNIFADSANLSLFSVVR